MVRGRWCDGDVDGEEVGGRRDAEVIDYVMDSFAISNTFTFRFYFLTSDFSVHPINGHSISVCVLMGVGAVNTVSGFRWRCVVLSAPRVLQGRSPPTFCPSLRCKRRYTSIALSQNPWPTAAKSTSNLGKDHTDPSPEGRKVSTALRSIEQVLKTDLGGTDLWMRRVQAAQRDLQSRRRGRLAGKSSTSQSYITDGMIWIAVLGDDIAGYRDVVTALVYDPLADSEEIRQGLLSRPFRTEDDVIIVR